MMPVQNPNPLGTPCARCRMTGWYNRARNQSCFTCKGTGHIKPKEVIHHKHFAMKADSLREILKTRKTIRTVEFVFSLAAETSANPGAIYVYLRTGNAYIGKILADNEFVFAMIWEAHKTLIPKIKHTLENLSAEVIAYGRATKMCGICGRGLVNKYSVKMGIGPICASRTFGQELMMDVAEIDLSEVDSILKLGE